MADICHLNLAPHYRGGERQTELLVRALAERGLAQRLVIKRGNVLAHRCADVDGLDIREVASNPLSAGHAIKGSKVAHSHDGRTVYSALFANLLYGTPFVITRRVVAPQRKSRYRHLAYRRASAVAAVSPAASRTLQLRQPDIEPIVVPDAVANFPVNIDAVDKLRARYAGKVLIGHIGALAHSHKGQSTIIRAARIAADHHPNWHFILCGNGPDEERFRKQIGSAANIELVGWVDNVGDYLEALDLFVYPSLHEALGSTILDAMQFGLPIVASNVGGIPDFVTDAENGRLIEPEDAGALVAAIAEITGDQSVATRMSDANRIKAKQFSSAAMAEAYLELYEL